MTNNDFGELKNVYFEDLKSFLIDNSPNKDEIAKFKVSLCRKYGLKFIPTDIEILLNVDKEDLSFFRRFLTTKPVRTGSGVAVIAIMSAPFRCPHGKCTYCPGGPDSYFGNVPQSYTGNEPATMRGIRNNYDAYLQVMNRLEQYIAIGQSPDKVELIIMGGTFPSFSKEYQDEFVRDAFLAMNDFSELFFSGKGHNLDDLDIEKFKDFFLLPGNINDKHRQHEIHRKLLALKEKKRCSLIEAQKKNETTIIRCVGLTIETKPDWGLLEHGNQMLKLGCTRVELGVQTLNENVLNEVHRGHNLQDTKDSIKILRDLGFKLNFHMMPGLPGISKEEDIRTFKELFENSDYVPDMLKVYPTMVMPGTKLYLDFKQGKYTPLNTEDASDIIAESCRFVPKYCRIMRVQRDIPVKYSFDGIKKNNLRQIVEEKIKKKGIVLKDIRSREIGKNPILEPVDFEIIEYSASKGIEYFISLVDANDKLLGFVRLRIPSCSLRDEFNDKTAIIRELHVYGTAIAIGDEAGNSQHKGFGKKLMSKAEEIAISNNKNEILVISGIGVREYYRKLGYELKGPYMFKQLD
ncbi:tRNA uridine(34) 5-carboxymethylaminomethyl modification radical SAM/GNAT enzyme Elp3 [Candidatus Woesearchaeota archaeon]|nr:tRNA uridine(34) 5-carboxymethylaminomethyl modification radical SAM/GNAT enzyme Elp3 [Candidatus Woesearchaeota archaeon]